MEGRGWGREKFGGSQCQGSIFIRARGREKKGEPSREESEKPVRGHHVQNRLGPHGEGLGGGAAGAAPKLGKSSELLMSGA